LSVPPPPEWLARRKTVKRRVRALRGRGRRETLSLSGPKSCDGASGRKGGLKNERIQRPGETRREKRKKALIPLPHPWHERRHFAPRARGQKKRKRTASEKRAGGALPGCSTRRTKMISSGLDLPETVTPCRISPGDEKKTSAGKEEKEEGESSGFADRMGEGRKGFTEPLAAGGRAVGYHGRAKRERRGRS